MEKQNEINLQLKILNFQMEDFALVERLPVALAKSLDKSKIQFEFNVGMNVDLAKKQIVVNMNTNFFAEEEKKNNIGHINTRGAFEVNNIDEIISKANGQMPNVIFATLIGVTLSTTRGFFLLKSENTFMEGTMIPIMNPMSFFNSAPVVERGTK
jgi:hypothetical protein